MKMATNIYRRKDGRFEARYADGKTTEGKTKYSSVYAKSYAEVKRKLAQAKIAVAPKAVASPLTITEAIKAHLEAEKLRLKVSTREVYQRYLDNHITPHFGKMRCDKLTTQSAQEFVNKLLEVNGLAVATVQSVFNLLKTSVSWELQVKFPKYAKPKADFLSADEQERLLASAKKGDEMNYIAIMLCVYTGIRIGEVCGLLWADIDLDRGFLYVNRTMQRIRSKNGDKKTELVFLPPKSATSEREITLPDFLVRLLRKFKAKSTTESVLSYKGKHIEPRTLQNRFKKILASAGIRDMRWHSTRHTFSVRMLETNADIKTLSELLGHASPVVTMGVYAHTSVERKRSCMNALPIYSLC